MIRGRIKYFFFVFGAFLLFSCSSQKEAVDSRKGGDENIDYGFFSEYLKGAQKEAFDEHFFRGKKERALGNNDKALVQYLKCHEIDPENQAVNFELAGIYQELKNYERAVYHSKLAIVSNQKNKWYQIQLAEIYEENKDFRSAAGVYETLIKANPREPDLYFRLSNMYIFQNKFSEAIDVYDRYEDVFGVTRDMSLQKHKLYLEINKVEKAADELKKLIKAFPNETEIYRLLAETYSSNGMDDEAFKIYKDIYENEPDNGEIQLALAHYYFKEGDIARHQEMLKKAFANPALDIDRKVSILFNNFLVRGVNEKNKELAFSLSEILVETHPGEAKAHSVFGDILYQDGQLEEAKKQYLQALDYKKNVFAVWEQLLFIDSELGDFSSMERKSGEALEYFPNQASLYFFNGYAHNHLKEYDEAVNVLQSGVSFVVNNEQLKSQFYLNLAEAYHNLKKFTDSDNYFEKALAINPEDPLVLNNYSYYLSLRNANLEKARAMSKKSLDLDPGNAAYLDTYGWILFKQGEFSGAREYIGKALEKQPNDPELLEHYGDILYQLGMIDEAVNTWQKAIQKGSDSAELKRKVKERKIYE